MNMEMLNSIFTSINAVLWDFALLFLLCGTGIWFTIRLKFVQVRNFKLGMGKVFGGLRKKGEGADHNGISSFQALTTAIAAQVGTGNLAGAATAIAMGGAGAVFWIWMSAFFGMATIYAEALMAQKHRTIVDGEVAGGPVYYIRAAFQGRFGKILAGIFSVLITLALGFMGNAVQANSIGDAFKTAFGISPVIVGVIIAILAFFIFAGGVKRIAEVTEKFVPFMAAFYLIGGAIVILCNLEAIPGVFRDIFVGAFAPDAVAGGVIGVTVQQSIRYGVARGLFSNEAGMGSTPHAHAIAKVSHPGEQGCVAIASVFIDTFCVLTMTTLVILASGVLQPDGALTGTALTQAAFRTVFGGFGNVFIAICMFFFAFSTIIGWYFFGEINVKYLFGQKAVKAYTILVCIIIVIGSALKVDLVWSMADAFNGLMVIPNLIGLLALTGSIVKLSKEFDGIKKQ